MVAVQIYSDELFLGNIYDDPYIGSRHIFSTLCEDDPFGSRLYLDNP